MITSNSDTLLDFWQQDYKPDCAEDLKPASLRAYECALRHWQRHIGPVPLVQIRNEHVREFREKMEAAGQDEQNLQKQWRHLNVLFRRAHDQGLCPVRPAPSLGRVGNILPKARRQYRKTAPKIVTAKELARLYAGAANTSCPRDWRIAIWWMWMFGARNESDVLRVRSSFVDLQGRTHTTVDLDRRELAFMAQKTGKRQCLPLTDFAAAVLSTLRPDAHGYLFRFPVNSGSFDHARSKPSQPWGRWNFGWRTQWRRDICAKSGIVPSSDSKRKLPKWLIDRVKAMPDALPPVLMKNLRQTAVTEFNDIGDGTGRRLGAYVAGHSLRDVDEKHYDVVTDAMREAFERRERERLPACFRELV